ncbi:MAG: hypothetical protein Q4C87_11575 [Actinomycetaceae bacterium]|nr:hypothetical protein [Actinomycetaceae bacterium]
MKRLISMLGAGILAATVGIVAIPDTAQAKITPIDPICYGLPPNDSGYDSEDRVQTMIDDMSMCNDRQLGTEIWGRLHGPHVMQGSIARGTNAPDYWREWVPQSGQQFLDDDLWNALQTWQHATPGPDNRAKNVRIEMRPLKFHILRASTNTWDSYGPYEVSGANWDWGVSYTIGEADFRDTGNGNRAVLPLTDLDQSTGKPRIYHGWGTPTPFDTGDVKAVHVEMDARLIVDDPTKVDDRHLAEWYMQVGADWYPETTTKKDQMGGYFPGVGLSRAKRITNEWRTFHFVNLSTAKQEPGASITPEELRDNPPPVY